MRSLEDGVKLYIFLLLLGCHWLYLPVLDHHVPQESHGSEDQRAHAPGQCTVCMLEISSFNSPLLILNPSFSCSFDIRCSFVFLLLLSAAWCSAYFYLRGAKMDEDTADVHGYCFICFNTLLGLYIFVFHCIQNEKIRREYRKYVRQHAWLPKCLRCSKTSISSGIVAGGGGGGPTAGTLCSVSTSKKPKLPMGASEEGMMSRYRRRVCPPPRISL